MKKIAVIRFLLPVLALLCLLLPAPALADELETQLGEIVQDFERHMGNLEPDKRYNVVVRSFVDSATGKPDRLCREVEGGLVDMILERFSGRKNLTVLERNRIEALEKEVAFEADQTHFTGDGWSQKLGKKLGAGFLITGTVSKRSRDVKIRARMIDIVTGAVLASSSVRVRNDEIDPALLGEGAAKPEAAPAKTEAPVKKSKTAGKKAPASPPESYGDYGEEEEPYQEPSSQPYPEPYGQPAPQVPMANFCCDPWGNRRCQLVQPVPAGSACFCPGQGWGVACP